MAHPNRAHEDEGGFDRPAVYTSHRRPSEITLPNREPSISIPERIREQPADVREHRQCRPPPPRLRQFPWPAAASPAATNFCGGNLPSKEMRQHIPPTHGNHGRKPY
jgi:hypothetical protein